MPTVGYFAEPGHGKTFLMRQHVEAMRREENAPIFLIVDHDGSWASLPGIRIYASIAEWWREPALVAVFQGPSGREVCDLAIGIGDSIVVDDEAMTQLTGDSWKGSPLQAITLRGRHLRNRAGTMCEVNAWVAAHRPSDLPLSLCSNLEAVYIGKLNSYADAERCHREGWLATTSPGEAAEALRTREVGVFTWWPP